MKPKSELEVAYHRFSEARRVKELVQDEKLVGLLAGAERKALRKVIKASAGSVSDVVYKLRACIEHQGQLEDLTATDIAELVVQDLEALVISSRETEKSNVTPLRERPIFRV